MMEEEVKLLSCPMCGDAMQDRGYGAMHVEPGDCALGGYSFAPGKWNVRAPAMPAPGMVEVCDCGKCLECDARAYHADEAATIRQEAMEDERAAVVKWLRLRDPFSEQVSRVSAELANEIERGQHAAKIGSAGNVG